MNSSMTVYAYQGEELVPVGRIEEIDIEDIPCDGEKYTRISEEICFVGELPEDLNILDFLVPESYPCRHCEKVNECAEKWAMAITENAYLQELIETCEKINAWWAEHRKEWSETFEEIHIH